MLHTSFDMLIYPPNKFSHIDQLLTHTDPHFRLGIQVFSGNHLPGFFVLQKNNSEMRSCVFSKKIFINFI